MRPTTRYEEIANSITHGVGLALSVIGLCVLIVLAVLHGDAWRVAGCSVFGASLVILYSASTLYHSVKSERAKQLLKIADHAAIYVLIAGTYTPFTVIGLRGAWGWSLLSVIWSLSLLGIIVKAFYINRFKVASLVLYIGMGWLGVIALKSLLVVLPFTSVVMLLIGGVFYTSGVIFFVWQKLPYNHTVWHIFVMAGSICHFIAVLACVAIA